MTFGPWREDLSRLERMRRLGQWQALALALLGASAPLTVELRRAVHDDQALSRALMALDAVPALRRRRLLSLALALGRDLTA